MPILKSNMKSKKEKKSVIVKENIVFFLFSIICYGATIIMMATLYCKYQDNLDSSQVSMKEFNKSPTGRYPSFTFCIYGKEGLLFNEEKLKQMHGITKKDYYDLLTGEVEDAYLILQTIDFDKVVRGIPEFLEEFEVENQEYEAYNIWNSAMNVKILPLASTYQDPTTNCFSYNTEHNPDVSVNALKVKFNITTFRDLFEEEGKIYIQAHYPGQMIRDMRKFLLKVSNWKYLSPTHNNNQITIQFPGVTLMRFRENAKDPCDPELDDDDFEWKQYVTRKIGCTPSYWKKNKEDHHSHEGIEVCTSAKDLSSFKSYWPVDGGRYANEVFTSFTKSCNKMIIFNNINQQAYENVPDVLKIKFRIREEFYQEILNIRGFGIEDLWGTIGGYVGIFCGYSILQGATYFIKKLQKLVNKLF